METIKNSNTLIQISSELYGILNSLKDSENKTYEKVILKLVNQDLNKKEEIQNEN